MESISGRVSPYLKPGIRASRPSRMVSRIVYSVCSPISLNEAGPYRLATTVGGVWHTAHRCWKIRRPSFCVSVNVPFGVACCARRGGEIIKKKPDTPRKNRIRRTTEASLHTDGWARCFDSSFTIQLSLRIGLINDGILCASPWRCQGASRRNADSAHGKVFSITRLGLIARTGFPRHSVIEHAAHNPH